MVNFDKKIVSVKLHKEDARTPVLVTDVKLPDDSPARLKVLRSEGKKWYLTVGYHVNTETPFALFCHTNSKEKTVQTSNAIEKLLELAQNSGILETHIQGVVEKAKLDSNVSKLTRTISLLLRHNVAIKDIVSCLDHVKDINVGSFLFQIKKFLSQYIKDGEVVENASCPECGGTLIFSEGCMVCRDCGNSKCG